MRHFNFRHIFGRLLWICEQYTVCVIRVIYSSQDKKRVHFSLSIHQESSQGRQAPQACGARFHWVGPCGRSEPILNMSVGFIRKNWTKVRLVHPFIPSSLPYVSSLQQWLDFNIRPFGWVGGSIFHGFEKIPAQIALRVRVNIILSAKWLLDCIDIIRYCWIVFFYS